MKPRNQFLKVPDEKSGSEGMSSTMPTSGIGRETGFTQVSINSSNDHDLTSTLQGLQALQKL